MLKKGLLFLFLTTKLCLLNAQEVLLKGKVTDTTGTPLVYANIIADPLEDVPVAFSISDNIGHYELKLKKNKSYRITLSYLGYISQSFEIIAQRNDEKNFELTPVSEELDEIVLKYTPPVIFKKDTISYCTEAFITGAERKLRGILKKLPAIDIDREGNVTVQGKKVTKVLVENKEFFTGNSKLAINNIPADAVETVVDFDNYNEVSFLKGLEDSNEMAMNIKLKEDKKRFIFGDVEIGGGIKERYLIHPSLYYYNTNRTVNIIGDFNNIGKKSFTLKDYLEFEGGTSKLLNDTKSYFSLLSDDFSQFLSNQDFTSNRNQFGAVSLTQALNTKTDFSAYAIWSGAKNSTRQELFNDYFGNNNIIENRINNTNQKNNFGIGKIKFKIKPNDASDITLGSYIKTANNLSQSKISTTTIENSNLINTNIDTKNISFKQDAQWHKQFSEKHTTSTIFNYHYEKTKPNINWLTDDQPILQGLIPIVDNNVYNIFKDKEINSHNLNLVLKHYMVLNRFNHIYITLGTQLTFEDYITQEYQLLDNMSINDFSNSNFGNDVRLNFYDSFFGINYKIQKDKITIKPSLIYHHYHWNINQYEEELTSNRKNLLLPQIITDIEFSNAKKLTLKYNLKTRFPSIFQFANRFTLENFNSIYQGDELLENELFHNLQLRYYRFNIFKNIFYDISISYQEKEENFKNNTTIEGIDFISSPILSNFEDKVWNINGNLKKGFGKYRFSIKGDIILSDYERPINNEIIPNNANSYSFGAGVETRFKNFPNFELGYTKTISKYQQPDTTSEFQIDMFNAHIEYDFFKSFIFKADYRYENYENKAFDITSTFDIANASLFYQKEDSPWSFEISANNIFNVEFKQRNSFSSILVSDEKTFILPRIVMFKSSYKL